MSLDQFSNMGNHLPSCCVLGGAGCYKEQEQSLLQTNSFRQGLVWYLIILQGILVYHSLSLQATVLYSIFCFHGHSFNSGWSPWLMIQSVAEICPTPPSSLWEHFTGGQALSGAEAVRKRGCACLLLHLSLLSASFPSLPMRIQTMCWLRAITLKSECSGSNPHSAICQLCDLRQNPEYLSDSVSSSAKWE